MMRLLSYATASLGFLPSLLVAQTAHYCPREASGVCYTVNVPEATASSGAGDLFFQISGPTSWSWIALGQGSQMANSNIFVIYTSASGNNVTLSPRTGKGHVMPKADSDARVTLLDGSGVQGGEMTANIRCENCNTWLPNGRMDLASSNTAWIWAAKSGPALNTDDINAMIRIHDDKDTITLDLTKARGGSSLNPFLASSTDPNASSNDQPTITRTAGVAGSTAQGDNDAVQGASGSGRQREYRTRTAHGVVMSLAFVIFFPLGAILVRVLKIRQTAWVHSGTQIFAYLIALAGMGLGVWLTTKGYGSISHYHPIIGLTVIVALFIQALLGHAHHILYVRRGHRTLWADIHTYWGRAVITLGMINGGLGLKWARNTTGGEVAYGVIAALVWVVWIGVGVWGERRARLRGKKDTSRGEELLERKREGGMGSASGSRSGGGSERGSGEGGKTGR